MIMILLQEEALNLCAEAQMEVECTAKITANSKGEADDIYRVCEEQGYTQVVHRLDDLNIWIGQYLPQQVVDEYGMKK